ncbi:hypothetical protein CORC01_03160 [Colletotrichum orchidophilum]|uniref:Uncharacterized protein n=1 Tax=Colletotrichum orchidophilum TaxID=1209926 RepID=A0A1G4BJK5_9PEZI|nr:uncharacterized protein CORC01_03160 [Colletotrichum orchidophilum]OHF01670.1 hypothetical protein CORC01_03160 [Colletotrichum orchidophilum]
MKKEDSALFWIPGVSLAIPPWPNLLHSKVILLHPGNAKRFGTFVESKTLHDRQARIRVNLIVLFRLLIRCQHLAFDHDNFWVFMRNHWGVDNASAQMIEELAQIYSDRRRVYLECPKIIKKRHDNLTNLIDAWNSRDPDPPASSRPANQEVDKEWSHVEKSWLDLMEHDRQSIIDPSKPPVLGAFPVKKGTASALQIRGGSIRGPGKDLFSSTSAPSADCRRRDSCTSNHMMASTPNKDLFSRIPIPSPDRQCRGSSRSDSMMLSTLGASESQKAIDDPTQSQGRKRRLSQDSPNCVKRQCVPGSPPCSPRRDSKLTLPSNDPSNQVLNDHYKKGTFVNEGATKTAPDTSQILAKEQQGIYDSVPRDQSIIRHKKKAHHSNELLILFETRVGQMDETMQLLKEQTMLIMESGELSRDIQKAHDQLNMLTASKCQDALERLDLLNGQISGVVADVMTCRKTGQVIQHQQQKQQELIESFEGGVKTLNQELEGVKNGLLLHKSPLQSREAGSQTDKARPEGRNGMEIQQGNMMEARLVKLEGRLEERLDMYLPAHPSFEERLERMEMATASQVPNADYLNRLTKMEEAIAINTTLINNCRTLVEVSKTSFDQHFGMLHNRIALVEHRLTNHVAEQAETNREQAKRMDRMEAELQRHRETISSQQQPIAGRQHAAEGGGFQPQLNALKNSLAVVARGQSMENPERISTTPLTPINPQSQINQSSLNRPSRSVQSGVPVGLPKSQLNTAPKKEET